MSKIDYVYKSKILKTDLCKKINKIDTLTFINYRDYGIVNDPALDSAYFDLLLSHDYKDIQEARKINKASYNRYKRLKDRIMTYLQSGKCIFATLTFRNDVLDSTSVETRRKYVQRYLKSISSFYVANIDFGSTTEREHYHAVILKDFINDTWEYGFTWFEKVRYSLSKEKISEYLTKLTNHGIKESTKRYALIYSRPCKD